MSAYSVPKDFQVRVEDLHVAATGLKRPECVLCLASGEILTSHGDGGYSVVEPNGAVRHVVPRGFGGRQHVPNGIALAADGEVLFADLGAVDGGIFAVEDDERIAPVVTQLSHETLAPSNFVTIDAAGTLWFTVSTRRRPRSQAWSPTVADGYIGVLDVNGARIVADGLAYTNEIAFSPDGNWVYTNETYGQRVSRFRLLPGPALGPRETVAQLTGADLPDGICFDVEGGAWITCIASNRVLLIRPDGEVQTVLEDTDEAHAAKVVHGIQSFSLEHALMQTAGRSRLGNISCLAFGGPDRKTAYLGCLLDDRLRSFRAPVAGFALAHWHRKLRR